MLFADDMMIGTETEEKLQYNVNLIVSKGTKNNNKGNKHKQKQDDE